MAWPVVAAIAGVSSVALGAYGASKSATASRKAATAERVAAGFEADQLEARAKDTIAGASFRADRLGKRAAQVLSAQRARMAQGGDSMDALPISDEAISNLGMDSLLTMANAQSEAAADRLQATQTRKYGRRMSDVRRSQANGSSISAAGTLPDHGEVAAAYLPRVIVAFGNRAMEPTTVDDVCGFAVRCGELLGRNVGFGNAPR